MRLILFVVALSACGGGSPPARTTTERAVTPPAATPTQESKCRAAVDASLKASSEGMKGEMAERYEEFLPRITAAMTAGCIETVWAAEPMACMETVPGDEQHKCAKMMTVTQFDDMKARMTPLMREMEASKKRRRPELGGAAIHMVAMIPNTADHPPYDSGLAPPPPKSIESGVIK